MPENTVSVDRSTNWGNPFRVERLPTGNWAVVCDEEAELKKIINATCKQWYKDKYDASIDAVRCYTNWLMPYMHVSGTVQEFYRSLHSVEEIIKELKGVNLACWCPEDQPCHADLLLSIANGQPLAVPPKKTSNLQEQSQ